jgi:hypothetical protein
MHRTHMTQKEAIRTMNITSERKILKTSSLIKANTNKKKGKEITP